MGRRPCPLSCRATSFYTYAVEFTADEAQNAGAKGVRFSQEIFAYLDNFLNFPVGDRIPSGYYDYDKGVWIPEPDGRVIKIVSIAGGLAELDTDGDGIIDNALGISAEELEKLADLYSAGKSLWRTPLTHFTPQDLNKPVVTLTTEQDPQPQPPQQEGTVVPNSNTNNNYGSIDFQNQLFGEQAQITGTPFSLHYSSNRVPGRTVNSTLRIPLCGDTIPSILKRIELQVEVAGKVSSAVYQIADITPNLTHFFTWDRKDVYGRTMQGAQPVTIKIGYVYDGYYSLTPDVAASFGLTSGIAITGQGNSLYPARREIIRWHEQRANINAYGGAMGGWDARPLGFGGWMLNVHHVYDPASHTLYLGDGRQAGNQVDLKRIINTVGGSGCYYDEPCGGGGGFSGDNGPATQAQLYYPQKVAFSPDGSYYIADYGNKRIRKVSPDGIITTVAGGNDSASDIPGPCPGDGGPATQAALYSPVNIAVGQDNSLYILDYNSSSFISFIRKVDPSGIINTIAGSWTPSSGNDEGKPAITVQLRGSNLALGPDGAVYITSDSNGNRLQRIGPDGILYTVAGTDAHVSSGDGGPALQASFATMHDIAAGPDGSLYIADENRVRRIGPEGIITTVAGTGVNGNTGDGGKATEAQVWAEGLAVAPDNTLYIAGTVVVRRVGADGIITTVAGTGTEGYSGDGGPSPSAKMDNIYSISVAPDGSLFLVDTFNNRIRQVGAGMPGFSGDDIALASEDGSMVYQFDRSGRHLKTVNAMTGADIYSFGYANNLLVSITDGDGNVTSIERDGSGKPTAIVAPFGQRTTLTLTR